MRYTCQTSPRFIKKPFFNIHPITQSVFVIIGMSMTGVSAHAATSEAANGETESTLPSLTFTTTATKTPTLVKNTIAQTTVIDEEQLQRYRGQSVLDVLRGKAGFYIKQNGGDGTLSNFSIRGLSAKNVAVLIDGIRYTSLSNGYAELALLPADQIDRIEVLYGASGSSLYGADATAGVIQIFTKGQNAQQSNIALTLGAGSEDSYKGQLTGQYVNNGTTISLSTGYDKTNGINISSPNNSYASSIDSDKDGFNSKNISFVAKHRYNDNIEVGITGMKAKSNSDLDGGNYQDIHAEQENGSANGFINYQQDKFSASLKYGESIDESKSYFSSTPSEFNTKQKQTNLQLGYQLPVGQIIGGAEYLKQNFDGDASYTNHDRNTKSGFLGYQVSQPKYDAQANIRYDKNTQYGNKTTYNLGGAYHVLPNTRVGASYATGFRMPSFNDLYGHSEGYSWKDVYYPGYVGNENLKAETSKNWEAFIEHSNAYQTTRLTGFQSKIEDGIIPLTLASGDKTRTNRAETKVKGVTLVSDWTVNNTLFGLSYTNQSVEGRNATQGEYTTDNTIPKNTGLLYLGYKQPKFDIRSELEYVDDRHDGYYTDKVLDSYTLLNLTGNYYLSPNLTINSRLNNLTDKDYETVYGYRQKGINSFVSLTYQWF